MVDLIDIPNSLRYFDALPDSASVRQPVVEAIFAVSPATVWRWAKSGKLPRPQKLGERTTVWRVGALREAMEKMKESGENALRVAPDVKKRRWRPVKDTAPVDPLKSQKKSGQRRAK